MNKAKGVSVYGFLVGGVELAIGLSQFFFVYPKLTEVYESLEVAGNLPGVYLIYIVLAIGIVTMTLSIYLRYKAQTSDERIPVFVGIISTGVIISAILMVYMLSSLIAPLYDINTYK